MGDMVTFASNGGTAAQMHCSEEDGTSTVPGIKAAVAAIEDDGGDVETVDYPGTRHAFFNSDRPEVYAPESAEQARERTVGFLHERLG